MNTHAIKNYLLDKNVNQNMIDSWLDCFKKIDKCKVQKTLFDSGVTYTQNSLFSQNNNNTQSIKKISFDKYNKINFNNKSIS